MKEKSSISAGLGSRRSAGRPTASGSSKSCIAFITLSSIPFAKKALITSGGSPEARSASSTRSPPDVPARPRARPGRHSRRSTAASAAAAPDSRSARHVGLAHRVQRLLAALAARRAFEDLVGLLHACGGRREVELLLRPEEAEEVGLRDAGAPWRSRRSRRRGGPCGRTRARRPREPPRGAPPPSAWPSSHSW